jgi:hypothetical protein
MSGEDEVTKHECVDCAQRSPGQASEYTLFSSRYGWRITKHTLPSGKLTIEWRCPECFSKRRAMLEPKQSERPSQAP